MASEEGDKGGRPSKFKPEFIDQAEKLIRLGATDKDLAEFFKVTERTLYRWKLDHPEFCQVLKLTKEQQDQIVERALYRRATGYTYRGQKVFQYEGDVVRANVSVHCPPDVTAAIFWLKNRQRDRWRTNPEEGGGGDDEAGPGLQDPNPDV